MATVVCWQNIFFSMLALTMAPKIFFGTSKPGTPRAGRGRPTDPLDLVPPPPPPRPPPAFKRNPANGLWRGMAARRRPTSSGFQIRWAVASLDGALRTHTPGRFLAVLFGNTYAPGAGGYRPTAGSCLAGRCRLAANRWRELAMILSVDRRPPSVGRPLPSVRPRSVDQSTAVGDDLATVGWQPATGGLGGHFGDSLSIATAFATSRPLSRPLPSPQAIGRYTHESPRSKGGGVRPCRARGCHPAGDPFVRASEWTVSGGSRWTATSVFRRARPHGSSAGGTCLT